MSDVLRELADDLRDLGADHAEADAVLDELAGLRDLAREAPVPSPALAGLLGRPAAAPAVTPPVVPVLVPAVLPGARRTPWARRSGAVTGLVVVVVSGIGATGLSAAANSLPAPLQERAREFSRTYLPFEFPGPETRRPRGGLFSADGGADAASPWVVGPGVTLREARPTRSVGEEGAQRPGVPATSGTQPGAPGPGQPASPSSRPSSSASSSPSGSPSGPPGSQPGSPCGSPSGPPATTPAPGQGSPRPTAGPRPYVPPRPGAGPAPTTPPSPSTPVTPAPPPVVSPGPSGPSLPDPSSGPLLPDPFAPSSGDGDRQTPPDTGSDEAQGAG